MGFFSSLFFGGETQSADEYAWEQYESGYASNYTKEQIARLNCSDEMKQKIERDIRENRAGGGLYQQDSGWTYAFDGLYYNAETNTYSNEPG